MGYDEDISRYYARCDERRKEAARKLREAKERGAPMHEIQKLQRAYEIAANTGD